MTDDSMLPTILAAVEDGGRVFDYAEVRTWPPGAFEHLLASGLLRETSTGATAPCPDCDDRHVELVRTVDSPEGPRYHIHCPVSLRVEVTAEMCRAWEVDASALAAGVAKAIGLVSSPQEVEPRRFWRLGRTKWGSSTREVVFTTRLIDNDFDVVVRHIGVSGRTIVIVPNRVPSTGIWPARVPAVVPLGNVTTLSPEGLAVDVIAMAHLVEEADQESEQLAETALTAKMRKAVKHEVKRQLSEHQLQDALVQCWRKLNSFRKAATEMSQVLGRKVTKDQVEDAVNAAGGVEALAAKENSGSVGRAVASQSRDRAEDREKYGKSISDR